MKYEHWQLYFWKQRMNKTENSKFRLWKQKGVSFGRLKWQSKSKLFEKLRNVILGLDFTHTYIHILISRKCVLMLINFVRLKDCSIWVLLNLWIISLLSFHYGLLRGTFIKLNEHSRKLLQASFPFHPTSLTGGDRVSVHSFYTTNDKHLIWFKVSKDLIFCHFVSAVISEKDVTYGFSQSNKWKLTTLQPNFTAKSLDFCTQPKFFVPKIYVSFFSPKLIFLTNWKTIHYFREVHKYTSNKVTTELVSCKSYCQEINSKKQWSFID